MKKLLLIVLTFATFSGYAQKLGKELGTSYLYANPTAGMGHVIKRGHGVVMNYGLIMPDGRLTFGLEMAFAQYGRDKSRQEYEMDDGTLAPMDIIVANSFLNLMTYSRLNLRQEGLVRPYVIAKVGYSSYSTDLNIYDPDDFDHCEPVESEVLYNDGTIIGSVGAGARLDFATFFKNMPQGKFYFDGSLNFTQGGNVRYMSEGADSNHAHHNPPEGDHVYAEFINTSTQVIHKHHVGTLYRSPVQMTELRFGVAMTF